MIGLGWGWSEMGRSPWCVWLSAVSLFLLPWAPSAVVPAGSTTSLFQRGGPMGGLRERDLLRENVAHLAAAVRRTSAVIQGAMERGSKPHGDKIYVTAYGVCARRPCVLHLRRC